MKNAMVKDEQTSDEAARHVVKIEQGQEIQEVQTVVLRNMEVEGGDEIPLILNEFEDSDGNLQIAQVDDATYTYIINNAEYIGEDGEAYEIQEAEEGEHYIIEEYHEYQDDDSQDGVAYEAAEVYELEDGSIMTAVEGDQESEEAVDDPQSVKIREYHEEEEEGSHEPTEEEHNQLEEQETIHDIEMEEEDDDNEYSQEQNVQRRAFEQEGRFHEEYHDDEEQEDDPDGERKPMIRVKEEKPEPDSQDEADDESQECDVCHKTFKTRQGLKRHITVCHSSNLEGDDPLTFQLCVCCGEPSDTAHTIGDFKCDQCDKLFVQQNCLERHVSIEHPPNEKFTCVECKKVVETKEKLIDHMRVHPFKSVKCDGCGREFTRKYHLDRHIGQTGCTGVPKDAFECRVCKKFFTRKDNLAEHLRSHAGITKKKKCFKCEYCSKEFLGFALLSIHVRTHTGEKPYACDICPKKFPSSGAMKKHRRMHTGEKPYKCEKCDKRFAAKETLNRHWRTHTGEKPHSCKFCGKSFIQASQLRAHIFHHTGENAYTCDHCGRAFNRKLRLTTHIKYMHEGAQPLNCPCPGCDKTFFRKEDVARHMLIHSGEKPFTCDVCNKGFAVKSSLKIHMLIHRKEPPVSCETCGRAFIRQDCLMRHMRARHRDVLEDIMASAEKKRLQQQLLSAATDAASKSSLSDNIIWNELTLTESVKELLTLLVDEECLREFGYPDAQVDRVLDSVIRRCGHEPASEEDFDYIGRMRENAKLLFTVVIDDEAVKELLNNQTVDEVILHVLKLAKKQTPADS